MVMQVPRGGRGSTQEDGIEDKDAKHMFDRIGKDVYDKTKNAAQKYIEDLKGNLTSSTFFGGELASSNDPCILVDEYRTNTISTAAAHGDPCGNRRGKEVKRFSDECGCECDDKKIQGNKAKESGACAPYRRLSLCNKNLEYLNKYKDINAKHYLLAKVCYAAKHEGESIKTHYPQYEAQYPGSGSSFTTCTMLARSFADIGDMVRGRDLYRGNTKEKKKRDDLEKNLKDIFKDIYNELTSGRNGKKSEEAKERYKDTDNYYELREDWWDANRAKVWEALTCDADGSYFHATCDSGGGKGEYQAHNKCRCTKSTGANEDQVPTYFDYVPQYLRWFEEWGEDFCRKKKKKLENAKNKCRGPSGNDKYCSLNGCDCIKTVRAKGKLRYGNRCTDCLYACNSYVEWIDKQGLQFDKQKNKYDKEIKKYENVASVSRSRRKGGAPSNNNYEGYEKKFYEELKNRYGTVKDFLEKLSKEKECINIKDEKGGNFHFEENNDNKTNVYKGIFYHSEYCQPCPYCGIKKKKGGKFEKKSESDECHGQKLYKPKENAKPTPIKILKSGERPEDINQKIDEFCKEQNDESLYAAWKCYNVEEVDKVKDVNDDDDEDDEDELNDSGGICILENQKKKEKEKETNSQKEPDEFQKTFYDFFTYWVAHMLKDSIYWRKKKLEKCLKNEKKKCAKNKCNNDCECFQSWIDKKKTEWKEIKRHFAKQRDLGQWNPNDLLEMNLKLKFFNEDSAEDSENSENPDEDAEEIKHIKKMLEEEENEEEVAGGNDNEKKTTIDKLLEQELKDAEKCKKCQDPQPESPARNLEPLAPGKEVDDDSSEDEDDLDEVEEDPVEDGEGEEAVEPPEPKDDVNVCATVATALTEDNLTKACSLKYGPGGKEKFPNWKCISDSGVTATSGDGSDRSGRAKRSILGYDTNSRSGDDAPRDSEAPSEPTSGDATTTGGLCIPPRRRKLYVGKLEEWATTVESKLDVAPTETPQSEKLRDAFIESAAVETFFLWHKFKEQWRLQNKSSLGGGLGELFESSGYGMAAVGHNDVAPHIPNGVSGDGTLQALPKPGKLVPSVGGVPGVPSAIPGITGVGGPGMPPGMPPVLPVPPGFPPVLPGGSEGPRGGLQAQLQPLPKLLSPVNGDPDDPETKLANGTIPTDFLRLMFYTLADYRDICIGDDTMIKVLEASGDNTMKKINDKIKENLSKQPGPTPRPQKSGIDPKAWWNENAKHIWEGMICALTYKETGAKGELPTHDDTVKQALLDTTGKKPKKEEYQYDQVKLDENSGTEGAKPFTPQTVSPSSDTPTTLTDFIKRPPYFRYLEEWGQHFCKERKKRLEKIKEECKVGESGGRGNEKNPKCSCYGEHCDDQLDADPSTDADLKCPRCGRHCRRYKKWIETKRKEFDKQKNAYTGQKDKCVNGSNKGGGDNGFCGTLKSLSDAAAFLNKLKSGPCKNDSEEGKKGGDILNFTNPEETFRSAKNCKPCSEFRVTCNNGDCSKDERTECTANNKKHITADRIKNPTENIDMLVSDKGESGFDDSLENACRGAGIFKGIRKDVWECGKVCGYVVCKPKNANGKKNEKENQNQIIIIRALVTHWVENFLDDYNKIRKKLNPCIENGNGYKCIKDCVEKWVEEKKKEWKKIKEHYQKQYGGDDSDNSFSVKTILEFLQSRTEFKNAIKPCGTLQQFESFCGLTGAENSKKNDDNQDAIDCMLKKLKDKIGECKKKHDETSDQNQNQNQACVNPTHVEDDDEEPYEDLLLEEEQQNLMGKEKVGNKAPAFCEIEKTKEEAEGGCDPAPTTPKEPAPTTPKEPAPTTPKEVIPEKKVPVPPPKKPEAPRPKVPEQKKQKRQIRSKDYKLTDVLLPSAFPLSVGIAFAALSYFVLKKKTKSSVGNLFQILQIPKSDYDIPTLKSSNRYIPYVSDRHKGKTYIYMEGDSSGDEKYAFMSDTTDVTSSESEYEELDINDIYVPGSPKYKTLIEVVLEPSKRDIQSDDTPSSDIPMNKFTDEEWNQLKHDFISNMLQNQPNDVPNDYKSENVTLNTQPNTLYFDKPEEKPFITSIHDRNLYSGEEYNYNVNMVNTMDDIPKSDKNDVYSGIDLINDSLNNNNVDIYDEVLKRKENELFGTNHPKHTNTHNVTKSSNSDPIDNQLDLFHTWLDRHRDMCEKWNNKEELLDKLKEEWNKDNNTGDIPSDSNKTLNTDVSIQIHMDNPKPINEFNNMDTILEDLDKYNEPYYDVQDDIYYDVNDHDVSTVDTNAMDVPSKVQIEMDVNTKLVKEKYPIADVWDI
ncbi:erythrocyte membrane protein 1, PfEMP1, putative [Plasmodium sp.]|nr:erythrocyte membrane protein 1, PfEMP1, putative [Plasmodium sp.]